MTRSLIFCRTCRYSREEKLAPDGRSGGEILAEYAKDVLGDQGRSDIGIGFQTCLWSCKRHCNVLLRDDAKYSYLTGDFAPDRQSAEAILEWFDLHEQSETGEVPFRSWPDGMRGHFIARIPPAWPSREESKGGPKSDKSKGNP